MNLAIAESHADRLPDRRGMLLITVLISLTIVMLLVTAWLRTIAIEHRYVRAAADRAQAELLAASGLERAAARLATDPSYANETWRIKRETLGTRGGAVVTIHAIPLPEDPQMRRVSVQAEFPDEGPHRAHRTSSITLKVPIAKPAPIPDEAP